MNSIIEWFTRHPVAANLTMIALVVGGLISMSNTAQEVFPEFSLEIIKVEVPYRGASPSEIEESIVQPLEQQLNSIEGVKEITAMAAEGLGVVNLEFARTADISRALDDVKSEVDRITLFPNEAEAPIITQVSGKKRVAELALAGDIPEQTLRELAYQVRDDLTRLDGISLVEVRRARDYEISIEVSRDRLRELGLSLVDISRIIREESLELPGGEITTDSQEFSIRTIGRNLTRADFESIILRTSEQDGVLYLRDVAEVVDGFTDRQEYAEFNGEEAVFLDVFRVGDERVLKVVELTESYFNKTLKPSLPDNVTVNIWRNDAIELDSRISLLLKNAMIGIALVAFALTLFLDLRLAFWVSVGIGVSFVAAFIPMSLLGISINAISMFGFILAIGIVVDDAIVTGENIFAEAEKGTSSVEAAVKGAQRVATPVVFAVATTVAAFTPLLLLPGILGKFLTDIPAVVILILALSLIESLLILPNHLSHIDVLHPPQNLLFRWSAKIRRHVDGQLKWFINGPLENALRFTTEHWFVTVTGGIMTLIIAISIVANGYIKFSFFPQIEGNYITASVELPEGSAMSQTNDVLRQVARIGNEVTTEFNQGYDGESVVVGELLLLGSQEASGGPPDGSTQVAQSNVGSVVLQLLPPDQRSFSSADFEARWREALQILKSRTNITVASNLTSFGAPVQLEVSADTSSSLSRSIEEVERSLGNINGVFDIANDYASGTPEFKIQLKEEARRYGLSLQSLAAQVRGAFFGDEALRVQRGRDEVRVYVRLPKNQRTYVSDLAQYRIRTAKGDFIPLGQVADIKLDMSPSKINRRNGRRVITVTADIDQNRISSQQVNTILEQDILPEISAQLPDVEFDFGGEARERGDVGSVLAKNFALALLAIFTLLAIPFRSYAQPLIVMLAIPFGLVGAVLAHLIMDLYLGMLSIFGLVGLAGVVINGALVQVDFSNELKSKGVPINEAWVQAGKQRFRPIFLTALTTFLGVGPLILEQSVQAQFLIPMAASIAFGVLIGTFIQMLIVPAVSSALDNYRARTAVNLTDEMIL